MHQIRERIHENTEIVEIAKKLADYGLGVFYPHKHLDDQIVNLPPSEVISEKNLVVRFITKNEIEESAIAVGWRWNGTALEVCSNCCVVHSPPPPSPPPPFSPDN